MADVIMRQSAVVRVGLAIFVLTTPYATAGLSEFLTTHAKAVVYFTATKTLPNGLSAPIPPGTGFVISANGYVLTAAHVADDIARETLGVSHKSEMDPDATFAYRGSLGSASGPLVTLELVALDDLRDLALFKIKDPGVYAHFDLASGKGEVPPDQILALGFPAGSTAIVPAFGRITDTTRRDGRWLIDAPVNHGHSGGPIIRRDGSVIGVVHAGITGVTLMNLMLPLGEGDPILQLTGLTQDRGRWPPSSDEIPARTKFDDIPLEGSCEERRSAFEMPSRSLFWACKEIEVPRGVAEHVEITRTVRVMVPTSAEIVDVRYFHRSRGDFRNPVERGPWHRNPPEADLQWMQIDIADAFSTGAGVLVEAQCHNWSDSMRMYCALGVQFRADARLW